MKASFLFSSLCLLQLSGPAFARVHDQVLHNITGRVIRVNQTDAIEACAEISMRLPTIRELAELSLDAGLSVRETSSGSLDDLKKTEEELAAHIIFRVSVLEEGRRASFFYNRSKYQAPSGDLGKNGFWSSSVSAGDLDGARDVAVFDGETGIISIRDRDDDRFAVRCIDGK